MTHLLLTASHACTRFIDMTHATFIDHTTDDHSTLTGPVTIITDYVRYRFPDAIIHGTSVNDGAVEFGKVIAHDANGDIWQRDPFTGSRMHAGNISDRT